MARFSENAQDDYATMVQNSTSSKTRSSYNIELKFSMWANFFIKCSQSNRRKNFMNCSIAVMWQPIHISQFSMVFVYFIYVSFSRKCQKLKLFAGIIVLSGLSSSILHVLSLLLPKTLSNGGGGGGGGGGGSVDAPTNSWTLCSKNFKLGRVLRIPFYVSKIVELMKSRLHGTHDTIQPPSAFVPFLVKM